LRKLILQMQMSIDGYFASADGVAWQLWGWGPDWKWDMQLRADFNAILQSVDCIMLSRKMIEEGYLAIGEKSRDAIPPSQTMLSRNVLSMSTKWLSHSASAVHVGIARSSLLEILSRPSAS